MRTPRQQVKPQPKKVRCMDCRNEIRDTDGISFRIEDGSFFLCKCEKGHHVDKFGRLSKLFIDHDRICNDFKPKTTTAK